MNSSITNFMKFQPQIFKLFLLTIITLVTLNCNQNNTTEKKSKVDYLNEDRSDFNKRMEWWRNARFGMFVHWGAYAIPGGIYKDEEIGGIGEWIMNNGEIPIEEYETFSKQFNPQKFDPDKWLKIVKEAGMKYFVITSKHHDGFGLWDSKISNYDVVDFSVYKKDILKKLSNSCKENGIRFGLYYSIMDWHHPNAQSIYFPRYNDWRGKEPNPNFSKYYEEYMKPQVKEIITEYDPDILWFDGEWIQEFTHEMGLDLYEFVRSLKPEIIINNRVDKGRKGMQGMNDTKMKYAGDFGTPEQEILEESSEFDWESCMTMNDTWGFKKNDNNWKSYETLIHNLIDITAKGGNYLLNVGPTAEGLIPETSIERLKKMGEWLKINGEAIYNTEKLNNNYKQGESIRFTKKKGGKIHYAIYLKNTDNHEINGIRPENGSEIFLLGIDKPLDWEYNNEKKLRIILPEKAKKFINTKSAYTFKIIGEEV